MPMLSEEDQAFRNLSVSRPKLAKSYSPGPIKPNNPSVRMVYKGQSSFGITAMLYTFRAEWLIKARAISESL